MDNDANTGPLYYESGPWKKLFLRGWLIVTLLIVLIAFILGLVKAKDDQVMYLLVVNLLISGVIGATIAWWFHKGHIKPQSLVFILFVGVCIIFQAVVSDIYVYHNSSSKEAEVKPGVNVSSTISANTLKVLASISNNN